MPDKNELRPDTSSGGKLRALAKTNGAKVAVAAVLLVIALAILAS